MKNNNTTNHQQKGFTNKPKVDIPGQFQTDYQGRIINNKCHGIDASTYSFETLYKKTSEEKIMLKKEISKYNEIMKIYYGDNWKSRKGINKVTNVPVSINKQTGKFELIN
jgi:hypothetical protein